MDSSLREKHGEQAGTGGGTLSGSRPAALFSGCCGQSGTAAVVLAGLQSGQLPWAAGAAPSGASLDVNGAAGEVNRDWGAVVRQAWQLVSHIMVDMSVPRELFRSVLQAIEHPQWIAGLDG